MFFDILSPISKPVFPNSNPKTSESDLEPEFAYFNICLRIFIWIKSSDLSHDLIEGSVSLRDRPPAQPSSSRSAQPHEPVITGIVSFFLIYAGTRVNATIMDTVPGELYTEYGWRVVLL
ncbi:hypothetical protein GQ457_17G008750 [Hibiscus cannabinus]